MSKSKEHWHLDKRVPVALIVTMASWIVTTVWWASALDNRVAALEKMVIKNDGLESRLVRLEEGQNWIKQGLERLLQESHTKGK